MLTQNELKQACARAAMDYLAPKLHPKCVVGVGTGSTANYFIAYLAEYKDLFAGTVSSSSASSKKLAALGIPVFELDELKDNSLDIYIDGADEVNRQLQLIKGGGGALTREKIVAACAREFVCIADESKWLERLGAFPLPVEVIAMASRYVAQELQKLGGTPRVREGFITDNVNVILDVHGLKIERAAELETRINQIVGVVSNGLFAHRPADLLLLATQAGVKTYHRKQGE